MYECLIKRNPSIGRLLAGGYTGERALGILKANRGQKIHPIVTDVMMPRMGGRELMEKVKKVLPDTKALFISGYPNHTIGRGGVLEAHTDFLQKPFGITALAFKVREVLDKK